MTYLDLIKSVFPITYLTLKTGVAGGGSVSQQLGLGAKGNDIKMDKLGQFDDLFSLIGQ